jgi:hypothetical protein
MIHLQQATKNSKMNQLLNFYDKLFLYCYDFKKSRVTSLYFPLLVLSTAQAVNLFFLFILIFHILRIKLPLREIFLGLEIGMILLNFYIYEIRNRTEIVLRKKLRLTLFFKIASYFYILASLSVPLILIYFINEYN